MGRLLYSRPAITVHVPTEDPPAPAQPSYEKWSYWNAFDPDSDEWFEGDDAVYEAFITDPSQVPNSISSTSPVIEDEDGAIVGVGARPRTIRVASPLSSESSESSDGERGRIGGSRLDESPSDSDSDDDTEGSISLLVPRPMIRGPSIIDGGRIYTVDEFIMRDDGLFDVPITTTIPNQTSSTTDSETPRLEQETSISVPVQAEEFEVPRTPPRTLGTAPLSNASTTDARVTTTPIVFSSLSPSPPPSVTPRLYSWAPTSTRLPPPPLSPTTNRGPLTNRNARMSVAHIQPSFTASVNRVHV